MPFLCARVFGAACAALALALPSSAQPPESPGTAQPRPPVQGQGEGQANRGQRPTERFSVPVRVVEDPIEAERAEERAQRAEKHDADDLAAQRRAAVAAERAAEAAKDQIAAAWAQTFLAGLGTAALLYTLLLTRNSVKEAGRSADAAKIAADAALESARAARVQADAARTLADLERPALIVHDFETVAFRDYAGDGPNTGKYLPSTHINFANYGRAPAVLLGFQGTIVVSKYIPPEPHFDKDMAIYKDYRVVETGRDKGSSIHIKAEPVTNEEVQLAKSGPVAFYVYGRLIYRSPLGERLETGFGYLPSPSGHHQPLPAAYNYSKTYDPGDESAPHGRLGL